MWNSSISPPRRLDAGLECKGGAGIGGDFVNQIKMRGVTVRPSKEHTSVLEAQQNRRREKILDAV